MAKKITLDIDVARRLFDLATDSPLICSGSFETDDVRVLRTLAARIGVDPAKATPEEFVRDFPHAFRAATFESEREWVQLDVNDPRYDPRNWAPNVRWETEEETLARLGGALPDECTAGGVKNSGRRCLRTADHPIHGDSLSAF